MCYIVLQASVELLHGRCTSWVNDFRVYVSLFEGRFVEASRIWGTRVNTKKASKSVVSLYYPCIGKRFYLFLGVTKKEAQKRDEFGSEHSHCVPSRHSGS